MLITIPASRANSTPKYDFLHYYSKAQSMILGAVGSPKCVPESGFNSLLLFEYRDA